MLSWEEIVKNYITRYSNKIRKVTQPLRDHFGINYFTYHRIDNQGKYTVLVDRPDWAEHYVSQKIFLNDPYLRHPNVYKSGFCLIESHGTEEYKKTILKAGKKVLNVDLGATLIQKRGDHVEFFGFCGNNQTSSLQSLYLNNPQLMRSFSVYFKRELGSILLQMEREAGSLLELKGKDFLCDVPIHPDITIESRFTFLKDLGLQKELEKVKRLTKRERECIKLLTEGRSAKETAQVLRLSPRTVESYFENIKNKLACCSKQQVFLLAKNFEEWGIL